MAVTLMQYLILCPAAAAVLVLILPKKTGWLQHLVLLTAALLNFGAASGLIGQAFKTKPISWGGFGFEFSLRVYHFNSYILLAAAGFGVLLALYCLAFMAGKKSMTQFYCYFLITLCFVNGAVLADDLLVLLFFWEGLLLTLFGMIYVGGEGAYRTAIKALVINGVTDLCMMIGIALTIYLAQTSSMPLSGGAGGLPLNSALANAAFLLLCVGAAAKAGAMPFHSWIPDAAIDAPLPFMALVPAALEKLLGIYFLSRITLDLYHMDEGSWVSTVLMTVGAITIVFAVLMALIQKDYKRLLSFHAISQVGYMILGIGTAVPAGIIGGIFHMINHAMYKCCLFLTGGAVERQTGTTDLQKLGGIGRYMPVTCFGFIVAALSISGVFPLNGFFSKELVYEGALERGWIYYGAALLGSFLTAASFLKLGHAAFFGRAQADAVRPKEAPLAMLVPILVLAGLCIGFGLYNSQPLGVVAGVLDAKLLAGHHLGGMPTSAFLVIMTCIALALALINHIIGVKRSGSGLGAVDHIHHAPVLHQAYDLAEKRCFDPYEVGMKLVNGLSRVAWAVDRVIDWVYNKAVPAVTFMFVDVIRKRHNGSYATYLGWVFVGLIVVIGVMIYGK